MKQVLCIEPKHVWMQSLPLEDGAPCWCGLTVYKPPHRLAALPGYEPLATVLDEALAQAQAGKGKERHADDGLPYVEQPVIEIQRMLGSNHGALYQAIKKARESARMSPDRARHELLGAIGYLAAAIIHLDRSGK